MNKIVTIKATFKDNAHYAANHAENIQFVYDNDKQPLSAADAAKIDKITSFYVKNNIFPRFFIVNDGEPLEGEAWIDLNKWSNDGKPRFIMELPDGKTLPASGNGGGRPWKTSPETSQ